ncbi:glycosyltransferase family 29 protein [Gramella sp. MAR_2010_147]|uniref:glycosyltransferase family 29 protein n=1 Tax=Gramella sp. MAR_2010_147 TaxID=1250205 RepID=UPI00087B8DA8|nr:glycosyltransferase family 29 protein [Gramella sp. MAR_2010_147]SDR69856.1 Glycosyltransferase family 29 (sialyltransferase) [Gramella sp. MAR_2010_147]
MKIVKAFLGLLIMPFKIRVFNPNKVFHSKRVAVIGPADSAYDKENGGKIDSYDFVVRMNKALVTWNPEKEKYLGTKTDILIHNFHENMDSGGGGPLDWKLFNNFGVKYLIQPRFDKKGFHWMFNYFKKYLNRHNSIYMLPYSDNKKLSKLFDKYHPTRGFYVLYSALTSQCEEVFITGFTFFKTPYAEGYRDNVRDIKDNNKHIQKQGFHNPDLEYKHFLKLVEDSPVKRITVDEKLYDILKFDSPELIKKVSKI